MTPDLDGDVIDQRLKDWATPRACEMIDAVNLHRSANAAAEAMGIHRGTISATISRLRAKAATAGYSPEHDMIRTVPAPFKVRGVSTYYNKEGKPAGQWVKSALDEEAFREGIRAGVLAFLAEAPALVLPAGPMVGDPDIIPWIQIGDSHLGMLAQEAEVGKNFDLKIAEREVCAAIGMVIADLPMVERLVINDLGDFTHYENFAGETEASGNKLDFDSRFTKMIRVYSRVMRYIVDLALTKAQTVDIIINQGNHSRTNDIWMAELLRVTYGHSERVNVLDNGTVFITYRMGKTLVMTHHGDKTKMQDLIGVMVSDFREDYGQTDFHYIDTGHIHHASALKAFPGAVVESFNTLAPGDKWHHDAGYRARQSLTVIYRSRTFGEVGRRVLPIQQVWDAVLRGHGEGVYVPTRKAAFVA